VIVAELKFADHPADASAASGRLAKRDADHGHGPRVMVESPDLNDAEFSTVMTRRAT